MTFKLDLFMTSKLFHAPGSYSPTISLNLNFIQVFNSEE